MLDTRIPEEDLREMLKSETGHVFLAEPILETIRSAVGWYRLNNDLRPKELSDSEIYSQAKATQGIIAELRERIKHFDPSLEAVTDEVLWSNRKETVQSIGKRIDADLMLLAVALGHAAIKVKAWPKAKGRKRSTHRDRVILDTVDALRAHSSPPLGLKKARSLAQHMLIPCRVHVPQDYRELQRLTAGKKRTRRGK